MTAPTAQSAQPAPFGSGLPGSPELLRSVFRQHAAGVAVITAEEETGRGRRPAGRLHRDLAQLRLRRPAAAVLHHRHGLLQLARDTRQRPPRRPHTRRAPAGAGGPVRPQRRRPFRPGHRLGAGSARGAAAGRGACVAGVPRGGPGPGRRAPGDHRGGGDRGPDAGGPSAPVPPGALQRVARLNRPCWGGFGRRWTDHSSPALPPGGTHGVLTSNIPFGAGAAPTGTSPKKAPMLPAQGGISNKTMR